MASSAACECGAEEQTVDHVVLQCPIHRPPHGLHGLTVLDDETTEWLLNTCPELERGQAVDKRATRSNERRTMLTSKIITEIIENHSEFSGCSKSCNDYVSSRS